MKKKGKIMAMVMVFAASLVWYSCTKDDSDASEEKGTIFGFVYDAADRRLVEGANVILRQTGESYVTGSNGKYEFLNVSNGTYSIKVSKVGYSDMIDTFDIVVSNGGKVQRDIQLQKEVASLLITDMAGSAMDSLDFGLEESVTSKSFHIYNNGTMTINCVVRENCDWISEVIFLETEAVPGQTLTATVIINRDELLSGRNKTNLQIISNNGSNELMITAIGYEKPTVETGDIDGGSITATSATCGGNVSKDGGTPVTERGICWATTNAPSLRTGMHTKCGTGTGSFSATMSGLTPRTTYYIRAYAINKRDTAYGEQKHFTTVNGCPTVRVNNVSDTTATSAVCGGTINNNGGYDIIDKGLVWGTLQNPSLDNGHISLGNGDAPFSGSLTNLSPSTTYYVRAYAINSQCTNYSSEPRKFTTHNGRPTITINEVNDITATSALCGGNISDNGGFAITDKGLVWSSTSRFPTLSDSYISFGRGDASFRGTLTNLSRSTTYYVRAYATNSQGTSYSWEQKSFTTNSGSPIVETIQPSRTGTTITTGGNVTSDGGYTVIARGICYGLTPNPDLSNAHSHTTNGSGTGTYSSTFEMSNIGTYYIRAYAKNSITESYGVPKQIRHPYLDLPVFTFGGKTYRVMPAPDRDMCFSDANNYCNQANLYGFTDWRLPTAYELDQMYMQNESIGGFEPCYYWTSTQCSEGKYFVLDFCEEETHCVKDLSTIVIPFRCIRVEE